MNKRRIPLVIFAIFVLLIMSISVINLPLAGVGSSQAKSNDISTLLLQLEENSLNEILDAFMPLVMYAWPTPIPTPTATATVTPTPTLTPTPTPTITPTQPSDTFTQCRDAGLNILDGGSAVDGMEVTRRGRIQSMMVYLDVSHTFVNDLVITLEQEDTNKKITLLRNPVTSDGAICSGDNIDVWLSDGYTTPVNNSCFNSLIPAISGFKRPYMLLFPFNGEQMAGDWELVASDTRVGDSGRLNVWCLEFEYTP
jgi:hypothetical protein